jgi:thiol-disulfide isomerase/thioredoxin
VASGARDFYTKYPDDPRAAEARSQERQLLDAAVQLGYTNAAPRLDELEQARLKDPNITEDERLELKLSAANRTAAALFSQSEDAARASLEKSATELIKEFPSRPEPYHLLLNLVAEAPEEKVRATVTPMLGTNVPEQVRTAAQALLGRLDMMGKPLDLKFTAVDGREVDLEKLRGKVVLLDFWATWCGPCIAELPNVKAAYERLNPQGFEIVGISFDHDKDALVDFVGKEKMAWPQYYDGKGWENAFGKRFGIQGIPTMWLIDKKGVLRDLNAREELESKAAKLLAESEPSAGGAG